MKLIYIELVIFTYYLEEDMYIKFILFIGRTGRFGKHGLAINLVDGAKTLEILRQIETHFGKPILKLDADDVDEIEKIQKN